MDLSGIWRAQQADDELRRNAVGIDYDDAAWAPIPVPGHWRNTTEFATSDGPLLYRTHFDLPIPAEGERTWVVMGGAFYQADVWLDGAYLGDPEGYFSPTAFDVTALARLGTDHVLAVEVSCPSPGDPRAKRTLTGAFQGSFATGGAFAPSWNPGGLWRPVGVETTGPVRIDRCRVLCRDANASRAHLRLAARLDSDRACRATVATLVDGIVVAEQDHALARGSNEFAWALDIANPSLWWPWSLGEQHLTDVTVQVSIDGTYSDTFTVRTGLREVAFDDWVLSVNGERLFLKGANAGPSHQDLATAAPASIAADVALARELGLDLIRLKGHIARPEWYDAADQLGVLIWQDLPLQDGYARSVRRQAVAQAHRAVDVLGHHPSIALWCAHDTPERGAVGQQLPTWNKTILDRWVKRALEKADETRPVIAHSGVAPHLPLLEGTDSHVRLGWGVGDIDDLGKFTANLPRMVSFVSEFGSQSVSNPCEFIDPDEWPRLDWAELASEYGLDLDAMERHVPPHRYSTFAAWSQATQQYQAELLGRFIEHLRRLKYRPTGGFCLSSLADAAPLVSTAITDHRRHHKLAFDTVVDACRPVIVVADHPASTLTVGATVALDVHVVSDLHVPLANTLCTATVRWPGGEHTWQWRGDVDADECARIGIIRFVVPDAPGDLVVDLTLDGGDIAATNRYRSTITR